MIFNFYSYNFKSASLFFFFFQLYRDYSELFNKIEICIFKIYIFESRSILIQTFNGIRLLFTLHLLFTIDILILIFSKCSFGLYKLVLNFKIYIASKNIYL